MILTPSAIAEIEKRAEATDDAGGQFYKKIGVENDMAGFFVEARDDRAALLTDRKELEARVAELEKALRDVRTARAEAAEATIPMTDAPRSLVERLRARANRRRDWVEYVNQGTVRKDEDADTDDEAADRIAALNVACDQFGIACKTYRDELDAMRAQLREQAAKVADNANSNCASYIARLIRAMPLEGGE